jgi:hypothetical protein
MQVHSFSQTNSRQVKIYFYCVHLLTLDFSSGTFSLIPAVPGIFYGRDSELEGITATLRQNAARVAILGPGGMGKTTLALAVLHHPDLEQRYAHRHFISCESATSGAELISLVGSYLGLEQSTQLSKAIFHHFLDSGSSILVLDNFETPWEPLPGRAEVERFLALLAGAPSLALLVSVPHVLWPSLTIF